MLAKLTGGILLKLRSNTAWRIKISSMAKTSHKDKKSDGLNLVAPTPLSTPRTTMATAWSTSSSDVGPSNDVASSLDISPAIHAAEITRYSFKCETSRVFHDAHLFLFFLNFWIFWRREQLTSWEQLRLNAARQRETLLERTQGLNNTYRQLNTQLRVRKSCWLQSFRVLH